MRLIAACSACSRLYFLPEQTDQQRIRHAYEQVVQAASGFADAVDRNRMRDTKAALDARAAGPAASARLAKQASGLQGWTPDALRRFNESGARLMRAAHQYEALCNSPAGRMARAELQLPGNLVQLFETAFVDAIGKTSGASVNVLGRPCSTRDGWRPCAACTRSSTRASSRGRPAAGAVHAGPLVQSRPRTVAAAAGHRRTPDLVSLACRTPWARRRVRGRPRKSCASWLVRAGTAAGGAIAMPADDMPDEDDLRLLTISGRWSSASVRWTEFLATPARHGVDDALDRFIGMGMKRLSPGERARIEASVFNLDHRPPAWLEQEAVWQSVARCCQKAQPRRPGAGAAAARRDSVQA